MPTNFIARILWAIPAANQAAYNNWVQANLDPDGGDRTFTVGLSPTGTAPATFYVSCGAYTLAELKKIVQRLCQLAGISVPANYDDMTRAEKRVWFRSQIPTIKAQTGIRALLLDDNDGDWSDYQAQIAAAGLKTIQP